MIRLHITSTAKGYSPKDHWRRFDERDEFFPDIKSARAWLKEQYGKCRRHKMYCEPNGDHIGYIFGFRNTDYSHHTIERWLQQDWVSFHESGRINPLTGVRLGEKRQ